MIGYIKGSVLDKINNALIIETSGVGYIVRTTPDTISKAKFGTENSFWTHMAVRENSMDLYGFIEKEELEVFEMLLTVSGIGPKSALTILGLAGASAIEDAVGTEDAARLTSVSGIGKKTAEKIVSELSGKMISKSGAVKKSDEDMDVAEALKALGYRERDIQEAMRNMPSEVEGANDKIKYFLKLFSK